MMLLALIGAGIAWLFRSRSRSGTGQVPVIGGDTWPPVPVKSAGPGDTLTGGH